MPFQRRTAALPSVVRMLTKAGRARLENTTVRACRHVTGPYSALIRSLRGRRSPPGTSGRRCHQPACIVLTGACLLALGTPAAGQDSSSDDPDTETRDLSDNPNLTVLDPMYFIAGKGNGEDVKARFQFSLRYRVLDQDSGLARALPGAGQVFVGYTQTSLWNWSQDSAPFEDSTYSPSLFWQHGRLHDPDHGTLLRAGVEHASNGRSGDASRSINTAFIQPGITLDLGGRDLVVAPVLRTYISRASENRDIADFRGYGELIMRYGNPDGWLLRAEYRYGRHGHHTTQLDFSFPLRDRFFGRTGGYLYMQVFDGYGESLLDYNERTGPSLRIGFAIVR